MSDNSVSVGATRDENRCLPGGNPKAAREGERLGHIPQTVPMHSIVLRDVRLHDSAWQNGAELH